MRILLKKSGVANRVPTDSDLQLGELALNFRDGKLYYKHGNGDIRAFIDSSRVETIANAVQVIAQSQLDSAEITQLVDSNYINARLDLSTILDSAEILDLIDSDYIRTAIDEVFTNSFTIDAETLNGESASYYLDYGNFTNTPTILDSAMIQRFTLDSSETIDLIDSAHVRARIDGAFISNLTGVDADTLGNQSPSYYLAYGNFTGTPTILDLVDVRNEIDSAHVQARQIKYNTTDFVDSDTVSLVIDSAYVQARQTNEAADSAYVTGLPVSTFTNDANYLDSTTVQGVIDQTYVTDLIDTTYLDSAETIALIDSAYVQLRQTAQDFSYTSLTNVPDLFDSSDAETLVDSSYVQARQIQYNTSDFLDSTTVELVVDSSYVRTRQDFRYASLTGAPALIDSGLTTQLIDSDYVRARVRTNQDLYTTSNVTFADMIVSGNLTVDGTTTTINSTTLSVNDKNIVLADSAADSAAANGAGITIDGANATLTYVAATDRFTFNKEVEAARFHGNLTGDVTGTVSDISNHDLFDSSDATILVDSAYVQARQIQYNTADFLDSDTVSLVVDSAYVQLRQTSYNTSDFTDSAFVTGLPVSTFTNDANYLDSTTVQGVIDSAYIASVVETDGDINITINNEITSTVDSAYVNARVNAGNFLDSAEAIALIDSAYVQARQTDIRDSAFVTGIVDSAYVRLQTRIGDSDIDFGSNKITYSNVYSAEGDLPDANTYHGMFAHVHATGAGYFAHAGNWVRLANQSEVFDGTYASLTGKPDFFDSNDATILIDSAYVQARTTAGTDSAATIALIEATVDSAYVQLREAAGGGGGGGVDSAATISLIQSTVDSAYVQLRVDSDHITPINQIVYLFTADSGQTAFTDSDDNSQILTFTDAQQLTVFLNGILLTGTDDVTTNASTNTITLTEAADSGDVLSVIKLSGSAPHIDSDMISNVALKFTTFVYTADSGDTSFSGADDNGETLSYAANQVRVHLNGILLIDSADYTATSGTNVSLSEATNAGDIVTIEKMTGRDVGLDSTGVTNLIDSAYVAARTTAGTDSSTVSSIIETDVDSAYVQLRQDFAYASLTGTPTIPALHTDFIDSAAAIRLITANAIDSGVALQLLLDSIETIQLIDSAYVQARQTTTSVALDSNNSVYYVSGSNLITSKTTLSLDSNPEYNIYLGESAGGSSSENAFANVAIGRRALQSVTRSSNSVAIGQNANTATTGLANIGIGYNALRVTNDVTTNFNAALGYRSGEADTITGNLNTFIGGYTGYQQTVGANNTFIGAWAGRKTPGTLDNVIAIGDSNVSRLEIPGLGIDTEDADSGQVLIWDNTAGQFYFGANGQTYNTSDFADSAYVQSVLPVLYTDFIDSAEAIKLITANAIDSGVALQLLLDSIETLALIDSAYITGKIAGGPLTVDGNGTDNGTIINGGLIEIRTDSAVAAVDFYCEVSNAHRTRVKSAAHADYSGNVDVTLPTTTGTLALTSEIPALGDYLDSSLTTQLIDSSYVQIRVPETYLSTIIDSTYVQARTTAGTDSAATISLIEATVDSAYVQLRQSSAGSGVTVQDEGVALSTAGTTLNFVGSGVTASGTGATKTITISGGGGSGDGLDSALVEQLVDSAYIIARQQTATPAEGLDSATALNLINQQLQEYPNLNVNKFYYTASAAQAEFSGADIFGNSLNVKTANTEVYLNGLLLVDSEDYTLTSTSLTLTDAADSGFSLALIETVGKVQALTLQETKYEFTATSLQTTFSGTDDNGLSLSYTSEGFVDVFMNGVLLSETNDYTTNTAGTAITLTSGADSGDFLTVHYKRGNIVTPTVDIFEFTADSGQTAFTGNDTQDNTLAFANEAIQVFKNGVLLKSSTDYTASNGTTVTLTTGADSGDDLVISTFSAPGTYLQRFQFNADSGQTNFSGQDISGEHLTYQIEGVQVFVNGLLQTDSDFSASNGTIITLSSAASANDEVVIHSFSRATNSAPITMSLIDSAAVSSLIDSAKTNWSEVSSSITLTNNSKNIVDCSGSALSLNMPGSPTLGDEVRVIDGTASAASNNITISGNGKKIQGDSSDFIIDINRAAVGFVFYNDSNGWLLTEN